MFPLCFKKVEKHYRKILDAEFNKTFLTKMFFPCNSDSILSFFFFVSCLRKKVSKLEKCQHFSFEILFLVYSIWKSTSVLWKNEQGNKQFLPKPKTCCQSKIIIFPTFHLAVHFIPGWCKMNSCRSASEPCKSINSPDLDTKF